LVAFRLNQILSDGGIGDRLLRRFERAPALARREILAVFVLLQFNVFITIRTVRNRSFWWVIGILFVAGFLAGYRLSSIPELRTYKLLNLFGIVYAFFGVLVLSEMLATDGWKEFCVRTLAPAILWIHTVAPLGACIGSSIAGMMHKPSSLAVGLFSGTFMGYSIIAGTAFEAIVVFPRLSFVKRDVETRWRWLGFFLVLGGVGAQLAAAVMDLRQ
jgi:hypothetical protein